MIMTPITGIQYPMPNKEYPIMKAATRAVFLGPWKFLVGYWIFFILFPSGKPCVPESRIP